MFHTVVVRSDVVNKVYRGKYNCRKQLSDVNGYMSLGQQNAV